MQGVLNNQQGSNGIEISEQSTNLIAFNHHAHQVNNHRSVFRDLNIQISSVLCKAFTFSMVLSLLLYQLYATVNIG